MNIDGSNILSLLSSGERLEKLQQTMQADEGLSEEFAAALLDKIRRLTGLDAENYLPENFTKDMSVEGNKQHEIAGLLNERAINGGFAGLSGKGLPTGNKLEKDINLENTLEALANVMNTLEDVGLEQENLETKLELLVEKIEAIRASIPEQMAVDEKLDKIVDELQTLKDVIAAQETGEDGLVVLEEIPGSVLLNTERIATDGKEETTVLEKLTESFDKVVDAIKQINDIVHAEAPLPNVVDLKSQIERLTTEIELIKDDFSGKSATKSAEIKDDNLQLANQITAIAVALNEPQEKEKITVVPVIQEPKPEQKKEALSLKQMAEERALGIASKTESETLLQQISKTRAGQAHYCCQTK
jgi:hypothetical protein